MSSKPPVGNVDPSERTGTSAQADPSEDAGTASAAQPDTSEDPDAASATAVDPSEKNGT
ncbi:MAG TPA: hypothetical protein VG148_09480 [Pyrinomonadaceae bacterium]|nr:hypothetical protein [Pyrinomonadaceae bacterium]